MDHIDGAIHMRALLKEGVTSRVLPLHEHVGRVRLPRDGHEVLGMLFYAHEVALEEPPGKREGPYLRVERRIYMLYL